MSAALLKNPSAPHLLEDDRESCFHVLVWTALKYSKHRTCEPALRPSSDRDPPASGGDIMEFLRAFDEAYADAAGNVRGGQLKSGVLVTGSLCLKVRFEKRPLLDKLVDDLNRIFQVRYENPPSQEDKDELNELRAAGAPESELRRLSAYKYQARKDKLRARGWLVDTIRSYLTTPDNWPDDNAERQKTVGQTGSKRKVAMDQANLDGRAPKKHSSEV